MNNCSNRYRLVINAVNNPVAVRKDFSNILVVKLGHDSASERKAFKVTRGIDYLSNDRSSIRRGIAGYIAGNRFDVLESGGGPHYFVSHLSN